MNRRTIVLTIGLAAMIAVAVGACGRGTPSSSATAGPSSATTGQPKSDSAGRSPTFGLSGWGDIVIGMSAAQANAVAPYPLTEDDSHESCIVLSNQQNKQVPSIYLDPDTRHVVAIEGYQSGVRTDHGIGIGSSRSAVLAAYSEPREDEETATGRDLVFHGQNGINLSFSFDESGNVNGIGVGHSPYAVGFEMCGGG
jgi:hypothetical protein